MSESPRTDEQSREIDVGNVITAFVPSRLSRQLECELTAALAKVAELEKCLAKFDELIRMLADLYNDKKG